MARSKIEWLARPGTIPESWNPIVGCALCSEGCWNCYAKRMTHRLGSNPRTRHIYAGLTTATQQYVGSIWEPIHWTGEVRFIESVIERPLHWKKPRTVFVCSMGDLFHEGVEFDWIHRVWDIIKCSPQHTFIVLTKRAERMATIIKQIYRLEALVYSMGFWDHIWLGVTVENEQWIGRIRYLLETSAAVRFVSIEPMLGSFDLSEPLSGYPEMVADREYVTRDMALDAGRPELEGMALRDEEWEQTCPPLDWVICGGETGPGARFVDDTQWVEWARDLRDQCEAVGIPFFFKQMPGKRPIPADLMVRQWPTIA